MYAVISRSEQEAAPALQRARGTARVSVRRRPGGGTRLAELFQEGCLKVRLPRPQVVGEADIVLMNTAGGLTGGDTLAVDVALDAGARATVTTPACERIYRAIDGEAAVTQRLRVATGARLDWLPQETILFDRGRLRRRLDIEVAPGAELLAVETIVFGRAAMGESVAHGSLHEAWTLRRDGHLIFADATRIGEPFGEIMASASVLDACRALATIIYVGPSPAEKRDALRASFENAAEVAAGASVIGDVLVSRLAAPRGQDLRRCLVAALEILRHPRALPRVWFC